MKEVLRKHGKRQAGVTSIEYGLLAALIAVVLIGAITTVGTENGGIWDNWTNKAVTAFKSVLE